MTQGRCSVAVHPGGAMSHVTLQGIADAVTLRD